MKMFKLNEILFHLIQFPYFSFLRNSLGQIFAQSVLISLPCPYLQVSDFVFILVFNVPLSHSILSTLKIENLFYVFSFSKSIMEPRTEPHFNKHLFNSSILLAFPIPSDRTDIKDFKELMTRSYIWRIPLLTSQILSF